MIRHIVFLIIFWLLSFYAKSLYAENNWERFLNEFYIRDISLDEDNVYCATRNGVIVFNKKTEEYAQYTQSDGLLSDGTGAIAIDKNSVIWVWTMSGIQSFDGSTWETYTVDYGPPNYSWGEYSGIFVDSRNTKWFWVDSSRGAISFDGQDWHTYTSQDSTLLSDLVSTIKEDSEGKMWFGCLYGVTVYDGINWVHYEEELRDKHAAIRSICVMKNNDIWFGGDCGGVTVYDGQSWKINDIVKIMGLDIEGSNAYNKFFNQINSIVETPDGMVWLRTGNYELIYDGFTWDFFYHIFDFFLNSTDMESDNWDKVLWIGTSNGLLKYYPSHTNRINENTVVPQEIDELRVYPNPSNNGAAIQFSITTSGDTFLSIYNILGQTVRNQPLGILDTGVYTFSWNGRNDIGESVESGVYVIKLIHNNRYVCNKMLLLK